MRTDHITAWLIKQWLHDYLPEVAEQWDFEASEQVQAFAQKIETIIPKVRMIFTSQNVLAKTAIEMWGLENVSLLAGGAPTPLTPSPDQLLYYTDGNPEAVVEAQSAGYDALQLDVIQAGNLQHLNGTKTVIATGLFHFLDDEAAEAVFRKIDEAGFHTFAFSHATPEADKDAIEQYGKLGIEMYMRDADAIKVLLPPGWVIDFHERVVDYMRHAGEVGSYLADTPHMMDFYKISKPQ